ncbi:MAG: RNA-binding protein [Candidatus Aenigmatarchaeota archaeon]|nr:MAG: RNA-binding protein [Candidatus Aenigmarchaeota archaeon]
MMVVMSELKKKNREFVIPGDEIIRSMDYIPGKNCFREGESIYAKRLGLVEITGRVVSVIPLSGVYIPRVGDMVIGRIEELQVNGWLVDINSPCIAYLPFSGVREYIDPVKVDPLKIYNVGDMIYAKVASMVGKVSVTLSMLDPRARKFKTGRILKISPVKIPRLIGKRGSMINLLKEKARCKISVGQNGLVWAEGEKIDVIVKVIKLIEKESHVEGLTDMIAELLEKEGS